MKNIVHFDRTMIKNERHVEKIRMKKPNNCGETHIHIYTLHFLLIKWQIYPHSSFLNNFLIRFPCEKNKYFVNGFSRHAGMRYANNASTAVNNFTRKLEPPNVADDGL